MSGKRYILVLSAVACSVSASAYAQTATPDPLRVDHARVTICAGERVTIHAQRGKGDVDARWSVPSILSRDVSRRGPSITIEGPGTSDPNVAPVGEVTITAAQGGDTVDIRVRLVGNCTPAFGGEMARFTVGYEQVGAAGTESAQHYALDVFMSRPLPLYSSSSAENKYFGPRTRWWGSVRIGSYPQQVNGEIAKFAKDFATSAGKIKVNELVRSAEFKTGPEFRLFSSSVSRRAITEGTQQRFALTAFAGWGGIGPLPPVTDAAAFVVPSDKDSPQYKAFFDDNPTVKSKYVAFVPPTSNRFLEMWSLGVRLYTFSVASGGEGLPLEAPPAIVEFGWGKNDLVADGHKVFHASAFYPFAFGDRTKPDTLIVYFFGDAVMGRGAPQISAAYFLTPAVDGTNAPIPLTNPGVTIVPADPNNRDTYRLGLAIDLMRVWKKLSSGSGG